MEAPRLEKLEGELAWSGSQKGLWARSPTRSRRRRGGGSEGPGSMCGSAGGEVAGSGAGGRQNDFRLMLFLTVPKTRAWQGPPSHSQCRCRTSHHTVSISDYGFNSNIFVIRGVCICQKSKTFMMTVDLMRETCSKHNSCFLPQEVW